MSTSGSLLVAIAALSTAISASADARDAGFYVGVDAGQSTLDVDKSDLDTAILWAVDQSGFSVISATSDLDDSDTTYSVFAGYRFLPYLAVELSWLDVGKASYNATGTITDGFSTADIEIGADAEVSGPALSVLGIYPFNEHWEVFGRAGVMFAETELSAGVPIPGLGTFSDSISADTEEFLWGAGISYNFNDQIGARVEYAQVLDAGDQDETGEGDVDRIVLGISYSF